MHDNERRKLYREIAWHQRQASKLMSVIIALELDRERARGSMSEKATKIMMLATIALVIVWDIVVAINSTPGDTVSEITLSTAYRHPIVPFAIGVVCGHLFWPQQKKRAYDV